MTERDKWENIFLEDCAEYDKKIKEEQIKQKAEEYRKGFNYYRDWHGQYVDKSHDAIVTESFIDGYHERQKEHEEKYKTAYIKGIRTMANALKKYDRENGAWTDYFEHKVDEVLKNLLKEADNDSLESI